MATKERDVEVSRDGLTFERYFTREGVHPFDEIEWEPRDAVIPNFKEGGNAFEQRDVEFPTTWSQNATNIVAQKYFRGPLGTPQRESSVRQMIGRVVDTITRLGRARTATSRAPHDAQVVLRRADAPAGDAEGRVQLAGVVQRRASPNAAAVLGVLHPGRRRLHVARSSTGTSRRGRSSRAARAPGINLSPLRSSKEQLAGRRHGQRAR